MITSRELETARWHISSYSKEGGDTCLEAAPIGDRVAVRDTTARALGAAAVPTPAWRAFVTAVASGRLL